MTIVQPEAHGLTAQDIRNVMREEFDHYLSDIEYRVKQAYEVERRSNHSLLDAREAELTDAEIHEISEYRPVMTQGMVYAEDISSSTHMITGYTTTANSPTAGNIAWAGVHIVFGGTDYSIADGNTTSSAIYYLSLVIAGATGTAPNKTATMSQAIITAKPTLANGDAIIFLNNGGTPVSVLESASLPRVVGDNAIDSAALQALAVTGAKIANGAITTTQISGTAAITGSQMSATANLAGTQLAAGANIAGTQISATAGLVGTQLTAGTLTATQLGIGAVTATRLSILEHVIY